MSNTPATEEANSIIDKIETVIRNCYKEPEDFAHHMAACTEAALNRIIPLARFNVKLRSCQCGPVKPSSDLISRQITKEILGIS
jgi:hypothetical protein